MQLRSRAVRVRLEWLPRDLWVGVYWEYRPHACTYEVCYNNRMHVWIGLLPALPLHVSWLVRRVREKEGGK